MTCIDTDILSKQYFPTQALSLNSMRRCANLVCKQTMENIVNYFEIKSFFVKDSLQFGELSELTKVYK